MAMSDYEEAIKMLSDNWKKYQDGDSYVDSLKCLGIL